MKRIQTPNQPNKPTGKATFGHKLKGLLDANNNSMNKLRKKMSAGRKK